MPRTMTRRPPAITLAAATAASLAVPLLAGAPDAAAGQEPGTAAHVVHRLEQPLHWNDPARSRAWDAVPALPAVQSAPVYGAAPTQRTVFRLAHDDHYLYAAAWMYDTEPDGIRAVSLRRDESSFNNDWFLVSVDTFRDRENSLLFATTPAGLRTDAAFTNDGAPPPNMAWNTFWDSYATRDADGWYAVIRIPFSSLRFQERDGAVVMGVTLARRIARRNEMISWPGVPHDWGTFSIYKPSLMHGIVLHGVRPATPVYATPYAAAGAARGSGENATTGAIGPGSDARYEAGLDLKYNPASNVTVDFTINPDFAQVEADEQRTNLTRFSLFFPERRPFFQERASVFQFGLGGSDRIFHSRRIGLQRGAPVRIHGGARMVAHTAGWDVGALTMQTAATEASASENAGVMRVRRQVLNDQSVIGGVVTSRLVAGGARQLTVGADALVRVAPQDFLTVNWAASMERGADPGGGRSLYRVQWERRGIYGLSYDLEAARVEPAFDPTLGFVARRDYDRAQLTVSHGWRAPRESRLLGLFAHLHGAAYRRIGRGLESATVGPAWTGESKTGHAVTVQLRQRREVLDRDFALGPEAHVPPGTHDFGEVVLAYNPARTPLQVPVTTTLGTFYDGRRASFSAGPAWSPSPHLQLSAAYAWNRIRFDARDQTFESHIARLRALVMFNTRISAIGFVQYSSNDDIVGVNLRLRYNPREGDDLYVVYDHSVSTVPIGAALATAGTAGRTLLLKYSRTFTLLARNR
jgi:opacity protein-like surface antigen